jgi:hypothetical protein
MRRELSVICERCAAAEPTAPSRSVSAVISLAVMPSHFIRNIKADKFEHEPCPALGAAIGPQPINDYRN